MAKSSAKQIIEDEKKILKEFSRNANKSINEIAKDCGFSRQKVWRVIKNLEKNKTIWGYTTVIDEAKQGLKSYILFIKRSNQPIDNETVERITKREIAKKTASLGVEVANSIYTNGAYDWVICFTAKDIKEAKRFVEILTKAFYKHISEIQLLEEMFAVQKCGIQNPEIQKLKDFFSDIQ